MRLHSYLGATVIVVVFFAATLPARGQSASAQAEILFRQGRELMQAGKYAEACSAFETSQKLDPKVTTLLNVADCREKNGQLATALAVFSVAEKEAKAGGAKTQSLVKIAANHVAKLQGRPSKLTITVSTDRRIAGLELTRNSEPIDPATWGIALPVDGGNYEIVARAPGHDSWSTAVTVKPEGDAKTLDVPALAARKQHQEPVAKEPIAKEPIAKEPDRPEPTGASSSEPSDEDKPAPARSRALPIALGVGGVVLAGGALGFELWARSTYSDAQANPDPNKRADLWHSANTRRYVADGMLGAGVVTTGIAVWLWLHDRGSSDRAQTAFAPLVSSHAVGLAFGRAW